MRCKKKYVIRITISRQNPGDLEFTGSIRINSSSTREIKRDADFCPVTMWPETICPRDKVKLFLLPTVLSTL